MSRRKYDNLSGAPGDVRDDRLMGSDVGFDLQRAVESIDKDMHNDRAP